MRQTFISRCIRSGLSSQTHFCAPKPQGKAFIARLHVVWLLHDFTGVYHITTSEWDVQGGFLVMDTPERKSCFKTAFWSSPDDTSSSQALFDLCPLSQPMEIWQEAVIKARGLPSRLTHRFGFWWGKNSPWWRFDTIVKNASITIRAYRIPAALHLIRLTKMFMGDTESYFHFVEKHTGKEKRWCLANSNAFRQSYKILCIQ